jgi:hypothetical protein
MSRNRIETLIFPKDLIVNFSNYPREIPDHLGEQEDQHKITTGGGK